MGIKYSIIQHKIEYKDSGCYGTTIYQNAIDLGTYDTEQIAKKELEKIYEEFIKETKEGKETYEKLRKNTWKRINEYDKYHNHTYSILNFSIIKIYSNY